MADEKRSMDSPKLRIVVPAYGAMATLRQCLAAIQASEISYPYEVCVVDDGGNPLIQSLAKELRIPVVESGGRGAAVARNLGVGSFSDGIIVFVDADVMIDKSTIGLLIDPLVAGVADATFGRYSIDVEGLNFFQKYKQMYISRVYSRKKGPVRDFFWTAIGAIRGDSFVTLGGFNADLPGRIGEDVDLGQRLTQSGRTILQIPLATGRHLKHFAFASLMANDFKKGASTVYLSLSAKEKISNNPHATRQDSIAVLYSVLAIVGVVVLIAINLSIMVKLACLVALLSLYILIRAEFVQYFARGGWVFAARAVVMMYLLDVTRMVSVVAGVALFCWRTPFENADNRRSDKALRDSSTRNACKMCPDRIRTAYRLMAPGVHLPIYVMMYVTHRCDAKCGHCFFWRDLNTHTREELTGEEIDRLAGSLGPVFQVTLTGGSPELRKDLPAIARSFHRHCRPLNLTICMNGYHTQKIVRDVEEILCSCPGQSLTIGLSLDGIGEEHDALRGMPGLFDNLIKTFDALNALKRKHAQLRVAAGIAVSGLNYESAERTARWARENLEIDSLKPILVRGDPRDKKALDESAKRVYAKISEDDNFNLYKEYKRGDSLHRLASTTKEVVQRKLIRRIGETGRGPVLCSASLENIVVHANGDILGCEVRPEKLGNLRDFDMDVRKIWFSAAADEFREKKRKPRCSCYHHCFLAPAIFRTPSQWLKMLTTAGKLWTGANWRLG